MTLLLVFLAGFSPRYQKNQRKCKWSSSRLWSPTATRVSSDISTVAFSAEIRIIHCDASYDQQPSIQSAVRACSSRWIDQSRQYIDKTKQVSEEVSSYFTISPNRETSERSRTDADGMPWNETAERGCNKWIFTEPKCGIIYWMFVRYGYWLKSRICRGYAQENCKKSMI